ncbi:hypothetical protein XI04_20725 [Bradyrhizobium sp. CCBAU 11430]|nr:hypothetical protein [Bradyrhizobium sp. CCBAU 11430]
MVAGIRCRDSLETDDFDEAVRRLQAKREELRRLAAAPARAVADMSLNEAAQVYWEEEGEGKRDADATDGLIARAVRLAGPNVMLSEMDAAFYKSIRRRLRAVQPKRESGSGRQLKNGRYKPKSINKYLDILLRIQTNGEIHLRTSFPNKPDPGQIGLMEKVTHRKRRLSAMEQRDLMAASEQDLRDILEFDLETGFRADCLCGARWDDVAVFEKTITLAVKDEGLDDSLHTVRLTPKALEILDRRKHLHPDLIFTFVCKRAYWKGTVRVAAGERYEAKYPQLQRKFAKARNDAGIDQDLILHDVRRTAARRVFEESGIDEAQLFLGHRDRKTTMNYLGLEQKDIVPALLRASARAARAQRELEEALAGSNVVAVDPIHASLLRFEAERRASRAAANRAPSVSGAASGSR